VVQKRLLAEQLYEAVEKGEKLVAMRLIEVLLDYMEAEKRPYQPKRRCTHIS